MSNSIEFYISEDLRKNYKKKLSKYFNKQTCTDIENGCYDYCHGYCIDSYIRKGMATGIYKELMENLFYNLDNNHKKILEKIDDGKIVPYNLVITKDYELDDTHWTNSLNLIHNTEESINNIPTVKRKNPCRGCGANEFFVEHLQTRSGDEPTTTTFKCKGCGYKYRQCR